MTSHQGLLILLIIFIGGVISGMFYCSFITASEYLKERDHNIQSTIIILIGIMMYLFITAIVGFLLSYLFPHYGTDNIFALVYVFGCYTLGNVISWAILSYIFERARKA